ncbi:MAG: hypothetical protein HFE88_08505 [Acutalibacter sp.]|nr:hypothetical protein [Acutalibacter sp.]
MHKAEIKKGGDEMEQHANHAKAYSLLPEIPIKQPKAHDPQDGNIIPVCRDGQRTAQSQHSHFHGQRQLPAFYRG